MILRAWREGLNARMELVQYKLDVYSLPNKLILEDELNGLEDELANVEDLIDDMMSGGYSVPVDEVSYCLALISFAQYLNEEIKKENETVILESEKPIKWTGKAAHLGYIMGQLADLGYIDAPKKKSGDINYNEFARQITKVFDFEGNNIATLAKMLSEDGNTMETHNRDKIQIPHIKDICSKRDVN